MLVTLSAQLYILCTCGITGFFVLSRLYGREDKDRLPGIGSSVVCGLVVLTAYAGYFSLFSGVGLAANIILIGNGKKETTFLHSILLKKELNVFSIADHVTNHLCQINIVWSFLLFDVFAS